jgi:hypothetical protein
LRLYPTSKVVVTSHTNYSPFKEIKASQRQKVFLKWQSIVTLKSIAKYILTASEDH